jgi:hypothetical protein
MTPVFFYWIDDVKIYRICSLVSIGGKMARREHLGLLHFLPLVALVLLLLQPTTIRGFPSEEYDYAGKKKPRKFLCHNRTKKMILRLECFHF